MTTERSIRNSINTYLKDQNWFVMPLSDKWFKGFPDLLCLKEGRVVFLEIKKVGGKVAPIQEYFRSKINSCGVEAYIVFSLQEAKYVLTTRS